MLLNRKLKHTKMQTTMETSGKRKFTVQCKLEQKGPQRRRPNLQNAEGKHLSASFSTNSNDDCGVKAIKNENEELFNDARKSFDEAITAANISAGDAMVSSIKISKC